LEEADESPDVEATEDDTGSDVAVTARLAAVGSRLVADSAVTAEEGSPTEEAAETPGQEAAEDEWPRLFDEPVTA
jgi:hypothetical protein